MGTAPAPTSTWRGVLSTGNAGLPWATDAHLVLHPLRTNSRDWRLWALQRFVLLSCIAATAIAIAAYCYRQSSVVGLSVCLLVTFVSPAETANPIKIPFDSGEPKEPCIRWGPDAPRGRGNSREVVWPTEYMEITIPAFQAARKINNCDSRTAAAVGKAPTWPVSY